MSAARLAGRVAVVTGAGGGIGRAHALALAAEGAAVLVNDRGSALDGGSARSAASDVVAEIVSAGGRAVADTADVGGWAGAEALVGHAIDAFGALDILVNNAGILRPRTLIGMSEDEFGSVIRVHLIGSAATAHFAGLHWRARAKADEPGAFRLVNTTSGAGLYGHGQANYAAAKAGIVALTQVAAAELGRYGATANAISPTALTRMSEGIAPERFTVDHVARLVCWLASDAAAGITGQVFQVGGGHIATVSRARVDAAIDRAEGWSLAALDAAMPDLLARSDDHPDVMGYRPGDARSPLLPEISLPNNSAGTSA
ncbi:SDR family NAD(P)-dependent oxidoreductase [Sphingomonas profundi]|uniref:SDR family NAD(P)-dependent oxidoreductase n=1 Tax=Alterirhizorhabdus profundi TaxID=2681549 RepID=UPI0012E77D78|nr:SDR family NAD(P)-dependent oxidoreductase [Sphingomonas profundi]